jgi:hypothetical protein
MKRKLSMVGVIFLVLFTLSCATFTTTSYRTLAISNQTYDTTLTAMGALYKEGKITEEQKNEIIDLGRQYKKAHNDAVDIVVAYEEAGGVGDKDAVSAAVLKASGALADLISAYRKAKEVQ